MRKLMPSSDTVRHISKFGASIIPGLLILSNYPLGLFPAILVILASIIAISYWLSKVNFNNALVYSFAFLLPLSILPQSSIQIGSFTPSVLILSMPILLLAALSDLNAPFDQVFRQPWNLLGQEMIWLMGLISSALLSIFFSTSKEDSILATLNLILFIATYVSFSWIKIESKTLRNALFTFVISTILLVSLPLIINIRNVNFRLRFPDVHPNFFGLMTTQAFLISLGLFIFTRDQRARIVYFICTSLTLSGLLFSLSRGSWIAAALGMFVLFALSIQERGLRPNMRLLSFLLIMLVIAIGLISTFFYLEIMPELSVILQRNLVRFANSNHARMIIWNNYLASFRSSPLFGIGYGNDLFVDGLRIPRIQHPHNSYLGVLVGTGLLGFFFMLKFLLAHFRNLVAALNTNHTATLAKIALAFFSANLVHMLVENFFNSHVYLWGLFAFQGAVIHFAARGENQEA